MEVGGAIMKYKKKLITVEVLQWIGDNEIAMYNFLESENAQSQGEITIEEGNTVEELQELATPIIVYLKEKGYAYPTVVIKPERVTLTTDEMSIPIPYINTKQANMDDAVTDCASKTELQQTFEQIEELHAKRQLIGDIAGFYMYSYELLRTAIAKYLKNKEKS